MHHSLGLQTRRTYPLPKRILSVSALKNAWKGSKDAGGTPGKPGLDRMTAQHFKNNLQENVDRIHSAIQKGAYRFSPLFPAVIPKANGKDRIICIPTVSDRLVQRVIVEYIHSKKLLPIFNTSSFGFIPDRGVGKALSLALSLRNSHDWVLKTDIQSFFDLVPRLYLKSRICKLFGGSSIVPYLVNAVDCEIRASGEKAARIKKAGIQRGVGVRQGMPLSPVLANIALCDFDKVITDSHRYRMIRYADDILMFFHDKSNAELAFDVVQKELAKLSLSVPAFEADGKSKIAGPQQTIEFLGREFHYASNEQRYHTRVSVTKINDIAARLKSDYLFAKCLNEKKQIGAVAAELSASLNSYDSIYSDVRNKADLSRVLCSTAREIMESYFIAVFGSDVLEKISRDHAKFLGLVNFGAPQQSSAMPDIG